ncbi:MAG: Cro/Cl family transcriptional regulator [marine bacterium B5-7]|nr:MAG: Cro/Cl family transcriptional regulator [marine bacterium B5-7]
MLNKNELTMLKGKELGKAIKEAINLKLAAGTVKSKAEIARHFGIRPPSLHGWVNDGSIGKDKLPQLWEYFSDVVGPEHWGLSGVIINGKPGKLSLDRIKGTVVEPGPDIKGKVPLISYVQAGNWSETIEFMPDDAIEWLPCPVCHSNRTFALRVRGESMYNPHKKPSFEEGDLIFVDPEKQAVNGSFVVVRLEDENEATFKKLVIDGDKQYLSALNPAWPHPIIPINSNAKICGVVIFKGETV